MGSLGGAPAGSYEVPTIVRPAQGTTKRKRPSLRAPTAKGTAGGGAGPRCGREAGARASARGRPAPGPSSAQGPAAFTTMRGPHLDRAPGERVAHRDPRAPGRAIRRQGDDFRVVGREGARVRGGVDEAER